MSPLPVRVETKASLRPSGEYIGRASVAGCETSSRATPPEAGAVQISPPETNAISERSGESAGSVRYGRAARPAQTTRERGNSFAIVLIFIVTRRQSKMHAPLG